MCYNSFQVPHCLIRFLLTAQSQYSYFTLSFFQPSFSEFLIFELYKKLLSWYYYSRQISLFIS